MLEKERESSDVLPAASSQHVKPRAGEVEKPRSIQKKSENRTRERERRPQEVLQHSGESRRRSEALAGAAAVRLSQEQPSDEDL